MAFTIPLVPPRKVQCAEDPLLPRFFYDEVIHKEEELGCGLFGSTNKARFKRDTVAIKDFILDGMGRGWNGGKFFKRGKNIRKSQSP